MFFVRYKQNSGNPSGANRPAVLVDKKTKLRKPERKRTDRQFCLIKKQNSGNQPEFQSSIKKRTVLNCCYVKYYNIRVSIFWENKIQIKSKNQNDFRKLCNLLSQIGFQDFASRSVFQPADCFLLNLTNTLTCQVKSFTYFFQSHRVLVAQTEV